MSTKGKKDLTKKQFLALSDSQLSKLGNAEIMRYILKFGIMSFDEIMGRAKGGLSKMQTGGMKTPPSGAKGKGLRSLPKSVRNNMGYMKDGGSTMKGKKTKGYAKGGMKTKGYAKGGMKKPAKMMGGGMNMKGKKTKGYAKGGMKKTKSYSRGGKR